MRLYDASGIAQCTCPLQAPVLDGCLQDDYTCFAGQLDGSVTRYGLVNGCQHKQKQKQQGHALVLAQGTAAPAGAGVKAEAATCIWHKPPCMQQQGSCASGSTCEAYAVFVFTHSRLVFHLQAGPQHAAASACGVAHRWRQMHRVVGRQRCVLRTAPGQKLRLCAARLSQSYSTPHARHRSQQFSCSVLQVPQQKQTSAV